MTILRINDVVLRKNGNRDYCFGTISSDKIKDITFVPVIEKSVKTFVNEIDEKGYQRPGSPSRMRLFKKFLMENPDSTVPPILISSRDSWNFVQNTTDSNYGSIEVTGQAAIVDGQHRAGGYISLYETEEIVTEVPFILLLGLDIEQEKAEFIVVNNSQKGVPKPLTAFLMNTEEAQIAWELNIDPESPLHNRITRTKMEKHHLFNLHSVQNQIKELFKLGSLNELDVDHKVDFAERYITIIADTLQNEWADIEKLDDTESRGRRGFEYKLLELTGLIAWCNVGAIIFHRSYDETIGMNWENVRKLVSYASEIPWEKSGQYEGRTGLAGGRVIAQDMLRQMPAEETTDEIDEN